MFCISAVFYSGKLYESIWKAQHESEDKEIQSLSKTSFYFITYLFSIHLTLAIKIYN